LIKYNQLQHQLYKESIAFCQEHNIPWTVGDLGPVYGKMWRSWPCVDGTTIDQLSRAITTLRTNPTSRRIIVTGWNPELLPEEGQSHAVNVVNSKQVLPPCHLLFQFYAEELTVGERDWYATRLKNKDGVYYDEAMEIAALLNEHQDKSEEERDELLTALLNRLGVPKHRLSCQVYIRSNDVFLGTPFNIAGYALVALMAAQVVDMVPGDLVYTIGDAHIYTNHMEQIEQYLAQETFPLPTVKLNPNVKEITDFTMDDIELIGYQHGGKIPAPVAV
jgi:thymidylate synthase